MHEAIRRVLNGVASDLDGLTECLRDSTSSAVRTEELASIAGEVMAMNDDDRHDALEVFTPVDYSVLDWPAPRPLVAEERLPRFPIEAAFPATLTSLQKFVEGVSANRQVPVEAVAMLVIAAASVTAAKAVEVEPRSGWREPVPIWALVILPSGERKSGIFKELLEPFHQWTWAKEEETRGEVAEHETRLEIARNKLKRAQRAASSGGPKSVVQTTQAESLAREVAELEATQIFAPSFVVTDATSEALAEVMVQNDERALVASPEGDAFDVMMGRYSSSGPSLGVWLKGHAGDVCEVRRRTRARDRLRRPALAIAVAVQPEAIEAMYSNRQAEGRGLLARFLACAPVSNVGYRGTQAPPIDSELRRWWSDAIKTQLDAGVPDEPRIVALADGASSLFLAFCDRVEVNLRPDGDLGDRRAWGSKFPGAILRIAAVLHVLQGGGPRIDAETMEAALAWSDYLAAQQRHVSQLAGADPVVSMANKILAWVRRTSSKSFFQRDAFNAVRTGSLKVSDIVPAFELLVETGWLRQLPPPGGPKAGRPKSPQFEVHPVAGEAGLSSAGFAGFAEG